MTEEMAAAGYAKQLKFLSGLHKAVQQAGIAELPEVIFETYGGIKVNAWMWANGFAGTVEERAEKARVDLEERIAKLVDLFPGAEWEKNDPTESNFDDVYYQLKGKWEDVQIQIIAPRNAICERVVVMTHDEVKEVPDPELVAKIPLVKQTVTKEIVEWQCNAALAEKTQLLTLPA